MCDSFFFFNDTATTEIYTLSLHDALPIFKRTLSRAADLGFSFYTHPEVEFFLFEKELAADGRPVPVDRAGYFDNTPHGIGQDRKSTRLNSSHANISYAVFCLKKKNPFRDSSSIRVSPRRAPFPPPSIHAPPPSPPPCPRLYRQRSYLSLTLSPFTALKPTRPH